MKLNIQLFAVTKSTKFEESNLDPENNTSSLKITITFSANNSSTYFSSETLKCTCNGVTQSKTVSHPLGGEAKKSFTFDNIVHNNDGTKTVSWSWSCATGTNVLKTVSDSGTKTLTTLHTPPTLNSVSIQEIDSDINNKIGSNWYVIGLSQKQTTLNVTYDDATFKKATVSASCTTPEETRTIDLGSYNENPFILNLTLDKFNTLQKHYISLRQATIKIRANVTDSKDGVSNKLENENNYNVGTYSPVTINGSVKREGQVSGQVSISLNGSYQHNWIGNFSGQAGSYKPTIKYKFWEVGTQEPSWTDTSVQVVTINPSDISTQYNTFTISDLEIGNTTPGTQQSGSYYFDYRKSYKIMMQVSDYFTTAETQELPITVGIPVWSEYEDHVNFERITRKHGEIYGETVLFEGEATTDDITLDNDSFANYEYVEVFYLYNSNLGCKSEKVYQPNGKNVMLNGIYDNGTNNYYCTVTYSMSGANFTRGSEVRWRNSTGGANNTRTADTTDLKVYRIVGYR